MASGLDISKNASQILPGIVFMAPIAYRYALIYGCLEHTTRCAPFTSPCIVMTNLPAGILRPFTLRSSENIAFNGDEVVLSDKSRHYTRIAGTRDPTLLAAHRTLALASVITGGDRIHAISASEDIVAFVIIHTPPYIGRPQAPPHLRGGSSCSPTTGARPPPDSAKAARLTPHRTPPAFSFVSGLRSERPLDRPQQGPSLTGGRGVPETQLHSLSRRSRSTAHRDNSAGLGVSACGRGPSWF
ncbi:uncharacterized protein C8Q71DRAFT_394704 [Rhodofomes roseus]|uniref:Uncharacterized protein n=1 Tax=Rhodofomes roseus TaxID=34475 RepID=A0ABQ8K008_9APHY|nr:uncharacterized protein C8Q71DRAFT_394704 [Rhodofomes roseus]KAH9829919.1 hypothetical protein C8Q71DRAFT_394704 [Rhodofomes roseus]